MTFFLLTSPPKSLIMRVQKGRKQMDNYFTQLSLLYSSMPPMPTDDELDMMEALAQLIRLKEISIWYDDTTGDVVFRKEDPVDYFGAQ